MSRDSRINCNLHVSLIEPLTDSIALIENVIIIKYYWQQFPTTQAVQRQMVFLQNGFLGVIHLSHWGFIIITFFACLVAVGNELEAS